MIRNNEKFGQIVEEQIEKRKKYRESVFYIAHLKKEKKNSQLFLSANVAKEILIQKPVYKYWKKIYRIRIKVLYQNGNEAY